jgi:hypothetical protein
MHQMTMADILLANLRAEAEKLGAGGMRVIVMPPEYSHATPFANKWSVCFEYKGKREGSYITWNPMLESTAGAMSAVVEQMIDRLRAFLMNNGFIGASGQKAIVRPPPPPVTYPVSEGGPIVEELNYIKEEGPPPRLEYHIPSGMPSWRVLPPITHVDPTMMVTLKTALEPKPLVVQKKKKTGKLW